MCQTKPAINQIELHPYLAHKELTAYCKQEDIVVEAYSPLTRGQKFSDPRLLAMSQKYGKTPAQVLVKWSLCKGYVVLPKSVTPSRIVENAAMDGWTLSQEDLQTMDQWDEGHGVAWDPTKWD